jgi:hypothetical protein
MDRKSHYFAYTYYPSYFLDITTLNNSKTQTWRNGIRNTIQIFGDIIQDNTRIQGEAFQEQNRPVDSALCCKSEEDKGNPFPASQPISRKAISNTVAMPYPLL